MSAIRTLIVDDDFAVGRLHASFLDRIPGFEVVARELTASAALRRIRSGGVDLVLLDLYLPDASGIELLRRLRADAAVDADVIMVSAAHEPALVDQAMLLGATDFILKPFTGEVFQSRLRAYASTRRERERVRALSGVTQAQIDALYGGGAPSKGASPVTRSRVLDELVARAEPATATEIADAIGLSRVSARRYLERLVHENVIEMQPRYGEAGRPQHEYWVGR
ncbi:response regulator [Galactobacter sp.]|uniref:response regulator n=1 Tax=Galactobacter sp. TaxID=2676125 RepID=UPI0025BC8D77|nr:response regulator [Galactobacter sp.]